MIYIHNNPVVARIVNEAQSYNYCSANEFADFKVNQM